MSSGKKTLNVALRREFTRCSQIALPFVLGMLAGKQWKGNPKTYVVIHGGSSERPDTHVVGELDLVDICAVRLDVSPIVNVVLCIHQPNARNPIPSLLRKASVGIITGISSKASTEVEEAAICNGVLVIVSSKILVHLPSKSGGIRIGSSNVGDELTLHRRVFLFPVSQPGY